VHPKDEKEVQMPAGDLVSSLYDAEGGELAYECEDEWYDFAHSILGDELAPLCWGITLERKWMLVWKERSCGT
jgi:hypothetical protein